MEEDYVCVCVRARARALDVVTGKLFVAYCKARVLCKIDIYVYLI
jgi:hypothetical protein